MSIEKVLLDKGKEAYDNISHDLYSKYHCYFPDCFEHPEYLSEVLKKLYGKEYKIIAESIRTQLEEFSNHESIARFLDAIIK